MNDVIQVEEGNGDIVKLCVSTICKLVDNPSIIPIDGRREGQLRQSAISFSAIIHHLQYSELATSEKIWKIFACSN